MYPSCKKGILVPPEETMLFLFIACLPKSSTPTIPTPAWALSTPQVKDNRACATAQYKFSGNLNLARSAAVARAREALRYPIAETILPYSQNVEQEFSTNYNLVEINKEEQTSVLKFDYQTETELVEMLPSSNPTVLWTKVCVDLDLEVLSTSYNQIWLTIHSKSISEAEGGNQAKDQIPSIEETLTLLQQQFLNQGIAP
jgi:hypothetical protein